MSCFVHEMFTLLSWEERHHEIFTFKKLEPDWNGGSVVTPQNRTVFINQLNGLKESGEEEMVCDVSARWTSLSQTRSLSGTTKHS